MATHLTRREFLRAGSLLAATAALAACAPAATEAPPVAEATAAPPAAEEAAEPEAAEEEPTAAPPAEEIELRMAFWDAWTLDAYEHEAELFHEQFPNLTVAIEMTTFGEYNQKLTAAMAGGVPPDVAGAVNLFFTSLAGTGSLMPLDPFVEGDQYDLSDFKEGNLQDGMWLGKLLSIPFTADGLWWFYNKNVFEQEGLETPYDLWKAGNWNWDTYLDLAAKLTKGEGMDKQWGTENITPDYDFKFYPLIWENKGDLFDPNYTKCILNEDEAMQAFKFVYDCRQFAPTAEDAQSGTYESGKVMMYGQWELYNTLYAGQLPYEWGCAPPPASPNTGEIYFCGDAPGWAIPTGVKHPDESWEWIKFLLTPESLTHLFHAVAAPPPRISMFETPDIFINHPNYQLDPTVAWEITQGRMSSFKNTPKISTYAEMKTAMSEQMSLVWADSMGLEEAVENVTNAWTELLEGAEIDPAVGCEGTFC